MEGLTLLEMPLDPPIKACKGLVFRVRDTYYFTKRGAYVSKREYYPLKALSCGECSTCMAMVDDLKERGYDLPTDARNGDIVKLVITDVHKDWETGQVDDWELEFRRWRVE